MKKRILALIIAIAALFFAQYAAEFAGITLGKRGESISVTVPEGASAKGIGKILKEKGLVKSAEVFALKVKMSSYKNSLNYGTFSFQKGTKISEMIRVIAENAYVGKTVTVTFPEGSSVEQMAVIVSENFNISQKEFLNALKDDYDYEFLKYVKSENCKYKLQGCLFPSTYEFFLSSTAHEIVDKMLSEQASRLQKAGVSAKDAGDILTKASIIEKEAKLDSERATVAGVIENRLKANMPLQIDACVVYAVTDGLYDISVLYEKQLKTDSLYNTYKYKGLTPGPICCPGEKSIEAAKNPENHEFLYYHTDETKKDGSHIFTKTFKEHTDTME